MEVDLKQIELKLQNADTTLSKIEKGLGEKATVDEVKAMQGSVDDIKSLVDGLKELDYKGKKIPLTEFIAKHQEQTNDLEKKLNDKFLEIGGKYKSQAEEVAEYLRGDEYKNSVKAFKNGDTVHSKQFEVKANTITTSNSFTQTVSPIIPYDRDPVVESEPKRALVFSRVIPKGATNSDYIDWVERVSETTGTAMKAEGATFGQSDISWQSYARKVEKATDYIKVTREKLEDADFVQSEIMDVLNYNIPWLMEYQILNGSGTSPNIHGLLNASSDNVITTFNAPTAIEGKVKLAQRYSALKAAILQVKLGNTSKTMKTGFTPNYIMVDPISYFLLSEEKDEDGQYLFGPDGVLRVMGVPVLESQFLSDDTFVVGDFSQPKLFMRRNMQIRMWDQNDTDPIADLVTFTATQRFTLRVKSFQKYAAVTGTFTNAINEILKTA